jgi:hypothetical protein
LRVRGHNDAIEITKGGLAAGSELYQRGHEIMIQSSYLISSHFIKDLHELSFHLLMEQLRNNLDAFISEYTENQQQWGPQEIHSFNEIIREILQSYELNGIVVT